MTATAAATRTPRRANRPVGRNEAVEGHLAIADRVARRYSRGPETDPDLYQDAVSGMLAAAARWVSDVEIRARYPLAKYLAIAARGAVRESVFGTVRRVVAIPESANHDRRHYLSVAASLSHKIGREPSASEVVRAMALAGPKKANVLSLARLVTAGEGWPELAGSAGSDGRETERGSADLEALREAVASLPGRLGTAVTLVFGLGGREPLSHAQAAREMGCSAGSVWALVADAKERIKAEMGGES